MKRYLSRYSKYDTHFNRTDQWKHVAWEEEKDTPTWLKVLAALGLATTLVVLLVI